MDKLIELTIESCETQTVQTICLNRPVYFNKEYEFLHNISNLGPNSNLPKLHNNEIFIEKYQNGLSVIHVILCSI